jgi:DNA invertase Pin-like site-specific DNA recombinase
MAVIGYERVSRLDQHPEAQTARLREHGCSRIFTDHGVSGVKASRPQWHKCLDHLRQGDTLVTVRLDRIGRSIANLIEVVQLLAERAFSASGTFTIGVAEGTSGDTWTVNGGYCDLMPVV